MNEGILASTWLLVVMALLPAIVLCIYVFKQDRVEKEPIGLLLKLLFFGVISCFPAAYIEGVLGDIINSMYPTAASVIESGVGTVIKSEFYNYLFVKYFFGVALVEEGVKLFILIYVTRKNSEFNSLFDGVIYSVFVSLGFAAFENLLYVLSNGFETAVLRAVMSVPGHMFFGVLMGYHYSIWHITDKIAQAERNLKAQGLISPYAKEYSSKKSATMCILIPVLAHGLYDFCCMAGEDWAMTLLFAFLAYMYVHCFRKIRKMSKADSLEYNYVNYTLRSKYPGLFNNN